MTYEQIAANVVYASDEEHTLPLLGDVLSAVGGRVPLIVELKDQRDAKSNARLCRLVADALAEYSGVAAVQSFNPLVVREMARVWHGLHGQLGGFLLERDLPSAPKRAVVAHFLTDVVSRPHYLACRTGDFERSLARVATAVWPQTPLVVWTARSQQEYDQYCRAGAAAIIFEGFEPVINAADTTKSQ